MNNKIFTEIKSENQLKYETDEFSFILKPSKIAGVGCFATHAIAKGTRLRVFNGGNRTFSIKEANNTPVLKKFCDFFGVIDGDKFITAGNFSAMAVGWYMNHCDDFNAHHDEGYKYFASRNIKAGEEITIDYNEL